MLKKFLALAGVSMALSGIGVPLLTATAEAKSYVVIAPMHGKKSHHSRHCRGLNAAKKLKRVTWKWAKHHHRPKCHYCY